jgi:hypothetical protein
MLSSQRKIATQDNKCIIYVLVMRPVCGHTRVANKRGEGVIVGSMYWLEEKVEINNETE